MTVGQCRKTAFEQGFNCRYREAFYYSDKNTVCRPIPFLFIRQHKLWNDTQLRIAKVSRFRWYLTANVFSNIVI